ncbi:NUDIX hydrolase [Amaricoccus macauensis]|uniref:NUDIX hydrolase n=1 Tax=Amaricoccus macauensis TaxID=57001 RepID=UPI003C7BFEFE
MLRTLWTDYIVPILRRPPHFQVAALCYRCRGQSIEILLVTSLETRQWLLPKGWPKSGLDAGGTALEEAWEEAGIKPCGPKPRPIGEYRYEKRMGGGVPAPTNVKVYAIEIEKLLDSYPEAGRRERRWLSPAEAASLATEPGLKHFLETVEPALRRLVQGSGRTEESDNL